MIILAIDPSDLSAWAKLVAKTYLKCKRLSAKKKKNKRPLNHGPLTFSVAQQCSHKKTSSKRLTSRSRAQTSLKSL